MRSLLRQLLLERPVCVADAVPFALCVSFFFFWSGTNFSLSLRHTWYLRSLKMQIKALHVALVGLAVVTVAADIPRRSQFSQASTRRQRGGGVGGGRGQVSDTDNANFINFCAGKRLALTNGAQNVDGSCNDIPMGQIPAVNRMVSTVITAPNDTSNIAAGEPFTVQLRVLNLEAGAFTDPDTTYYSAPQALNDNGQIIGHTHVTIQSTGTTLNPQNPLNPQKPAFFKGIDDAGNKGILSAAVSGLKAGNYRVCSMSSAANHQPVLMPVAERGAQDDCVRFTVGGKGRGKKVGKGVETAASRPKAGSRPSRKSGQPRQVGQR
ncbi:Uncharacterized protein TPAR_07255 [Tolypocladium paradoxum]|uniref:Ribosomal protein s17 n=1 Tax=Tolypocladium paradoxum TaxID=94208 RepID=A0A2S4KQT9_9HYPO|nr:Uncharacterized protein TPAR_07255 [Tolypocladium paradoxum]